MNFANVKSLTIPEGSVKKISVNGVDIWQKSAPVPSGPWEELFASINAGTYRTDYSIGDLIPLDLGTEGSINMQIAGFDCDPLAAGGNYAAVSLISKELLTTSHRMNPARTPSSAPYDEGTGTIGGWEKSEMRSYLKNTIKPLIPSAVRNAIVEVTKTQISYTVSGSSETQTTTDDVWIPSRSEIQTSEAIYPVLFPDSASRKKSKVGGSATQWWTRQAYSSSNFYPYTSSGSPTNDPANFSYGVALGFCVGVGAPLPSAAMLLNTMTRPTAYNPALDDGEDIPDEQALEIITGGEN